MERTASSSTWKTSGEAHNLGFNVYREQNGNQSAHEFLAHRGIGPADERRSLPSMRAELTRGLILPPTLTEASYWLEDIDVNGTRTMHGPVSADAGC